jgi:hypothetical protein
LKARIHSQTTSRALEVQKYLLPNVTTPFGLAVVPDPVFAICAEIAPMLSQEHVMLVSYNMLIPYILLIFHMTLKDTRIDLQRLDAFVSGANQNVIDIRDLIQTRFSRATVMLGNFRDETEAQLSKLSANIAALRTLELTSAESSGPETDAAAASQNGS